MILFWSWFTIFLGYDRCLILQLDWFSLCLSIFLSTNMKMHYYHWKNQYEKTITSMIVNLWIRSFKLRMSYFVPRYLTYVYFHLSLQNRKKCCIKSTLYNGTRSVVWYTCYIIFQIKGEIFDLYRCKCFDLQLLISTHSSSCNRID